mmetsp:Transcript_101854/g.287342  ORF Transcript_101854/g.287342 Transcript_101854/m.287342 type:complete len:334 (-) Transcript_101854:783-1784(-)
MGRLRQSSIACCKMVGRANGHRGRSLWRLSADLARDWGWHLRPSSLWPAASLGPRRRGPALEAVECASRCWLSPTWLRLSRRWDSSTSTCSLGPCPTSRQTSQVLPYQWMRYCGPSRRLITGDTPWRRLSRGAQGQVAKRTRRSASCFRTFRRRFNSRCEASTPWLATSSSCARHYCPPPTLRAPRRPSRARGCCRRCRLSTSSVRPTAVASRLLRRRSRLQSPSVAARRSLSTCVTKRQPMLLRWIARTLALSPPRKLLRSRREQPLLTRSPMKRQCLAGFSPSSTQQPAPAVRRAREGRPRVHPRRGGSFAIPRCCSPTRGILPQPARRKE